jgi:tRNA G18 (ribose-2'-O)-methylase SpoU
VRPAGPRRILARVATIRISTRNARFQQWQALLTNRTTRQRTGEFLIHGVRPISLAVDYGWPLRALAYPDGPRLSRWAADLLDRVDAPRVAMEPELLRELSERDSPEPPELLAVGGLPEDDLGRVAANPRLLAVVFDRPTSPGNLGTLIRSADAFGADGLVVTGHAADPFDPRAVRASTGSLFALPVVRTGSHREVLDRVAAMRRDGVAVTVVGTDEHGDIELTEHDLTRPTLLVIGNETAGLSAGWRASCDRMARIPITGAASSLNAADAGAIALYEAVRQRRAAASRP